MIEPIKIACVTTILPLWVLVLIAAFFFCEAPSAGQTAVAVWTNRYNGPWNLDDRAAGIVVDGAGNVIVAGYSTGSSYYKDYLVIKYSSAGMALWTNRYDGPVGRDDQPIALAVDGAGNVFVTGISLGGSSYFDYATIGYSPAGMALWTNRYNGPGNSVDSPSMGVKLSSAVPPPHSLARKYS